MTHMIKWIFSLVITSLFGFSTTVLATQSTHLAQRLSHDTTAGIESLRDIEDSAFGEEASIIDADVSAAISGVVMVPAAPPTQAQTGAAAAQLTPASVLSAVGAIEVAHRRQVVLATNGAVKEIAVGAGDSVRAGDLLIALDTTFLEWSLEQAEINFETARINFEELGETVSESDLAVAEANLLLAQENLAQAREGPSAEELAAAQAAAASAWARHEELQQQPTQAQINQALANLRRAEVNVQAAQRDYDRIAWLPESAASPEADALHRATIELEAAQASFDEVNRPATQSELQGALSAAQSAQANLNDLRRRPTPAEIANAEANLASAAAYEQALLGPREAELRISELSVRQAMIALEQARLALEDANVVAPIDGVVLSIHVELGQQASAGALVATLADPLDLRVVVDVEERDIGQVRPGQGVEISVSAMPGVIFLGVVDRIVPAADVGADIVTYPVIIELIDGPLERLLPGMTASAVFLAAVDEAAEPAVEESEPPADETGDVGVEVEADSEQDAETAADAEEAVEHEETEESAAESEGETDTDADAESDEESGQE